LLFAPLLLAVTVVIAGFVITILAITFIFAILILAVISAPAGMFYLRWFDWRSMKSIDKSLAKIKAAATGGVQHA
jgi:hypothetical protein